MGIAKKVALVCGAVVLGCLAYLIYDAAVDHKLEIGDYDTREKILMAAIAAHVITWLATIIIPERPSNKDF